MLNNDQNLKSVLASVIDEEVKEMLQMFNEIEALHDQQTRAIDRLNEKMLCVIEAIRMYRLVETNGQNR